MGFITRFVGDSHTFDWEDVGVESYDSPEVCGVSVRRLIGPAEGAPHFAVRYFEIRPGGSTSLDRHEHDHGVVVLRGKGEVLLGDELRGISHGDAIYVSPNEVHQFRSTGQGPLGFLCVIPAQKSDKS